MADARDLNSLGRKAVRVRLPSSVSPSIMTTTTLVRGVACLPGLPGAGVLPGLNKGRQSWRGGCTHMEERKLWSEVAKIIRSYERRRKKSELREGRLADDTLATRLPRETEAAPDEPPAHGARPRLPRKRFSPRSGPGHDPQLRRMERFTQAIREILRHDHEVNLDVTLRGDMARAFHITLALGKHLWDLDEELVVQRILQCGVERLIEEHNADLAPTETPKSFRAFVDEVLGELEGDEP